VGRAPLARRLLAGSLDRAVDVAATLELRGYGLSAPRAKRELFRSRYDTRFYATGATVLIAAIVGKILGADEFSAYSTIVIGTSSLTLALAALVAASGLAPHA
jgi:energy-coupling factor transport system permease protein